MDFRIEIVWSTNQQIGSRFTEFRTVLVTVNLDLGSTINFEVGDFDKKRVICSNRRRRYRHSKMRT